MVRLCRASHYRVKIDRNISENNTADSKDALHNFNITILTDTAVRTFEQEEFSSHFLHA